MPTFVNVSNFLARANLSLYGMPRRELGLFEQTRIQERCLLDSSRWMLLNKPSEFRAFGDFLAQYGPWTQADVKEMTRWEINAVLMNFVASEVIFHSLDLPDPNWEAYAAKTEQGLIEGRLFRLPYNNSIWYRLD